MADSGGSGAGAGRFSRRWWLWLFTIAYLVALAAVLLSLRLLSDVWWPATLLLFGPRWIYAAPLALLVPMALAWRRSLLVPLAVAALVVGVWIMDLTVTLKGLGRAFGGAPTTKADGVLRVMTFNVGGGKIGPADVERALAEISPDVAVFQECHYALDEPSLVSQGYAVRSDEGMCLASKLPLVSVGAVARTEYENRTGAGKVHLYTLDAHGREIIVVNAHFETVREALEALRERKWRGGPAMDANIGIRERESKRARAHVDTLTAPFIVAGDFNMPRESAIFRASWGSFTSAFSEAGLGYGNSKVARLFGVRIDHVLVGSGWQVEGAWLGAGAGGDHRPLVTELRLQN